MTIKEFQVSLDKRVKNLKNFTEPLRVAAFDVTAMMGERIFDEGRKTDGSQIINHKAGVGGSQLYSEKPIYISANAVPRPRGVLAGKPKEGKKRGRTKRDVKRKGELFAVETKHNSKYFATGYKGYRENVGRQTGFIDLSLTGELRMDFGNQKQVAEPRKISEEEYQIRLDKDINQKKRGGMEEKYGTIFSVSESEKDLFFKTIQFEFNNRLSQGK